MGASESITAACYVDSVHRLAAWASWLALAACSGDPGGRVATGERDAAADDVGARDGTASIDAPPPGSDAAADGAVPTDAGPLDAAVEASPDAGPVTRPLDSFEELFASKFSPRTEPSAIADHPPSALGIHCLGAALALRRAREGAAFDPSFVSELQSALELNADRLVELSPNFVGGWGEGEARDWFSDGSTNPADVADGYNTAYATWCLSEAAHTLQTSDPVRATTYRDLVEQRLAAYRNAGYAGPGDANQHCTDCGYFWYTVHSNDEGRYVKNINSLMGATSLVLDLYGNDDASENAGRQATRSHSREIGTDGDKNLNYLSRLDPLYDPAKQVNNTHNYIESYVMLRAGEVLRSATYICRALGQYRAWSPQVLSSQPTQVAYASCHFARRDAEALSRCQAWVDSGKGLTNLGGVGLVMEYWADDTRTAEQMCN